MSVLNPWAQLKHKLPMINAYVIEVNKNKMNEIISNDGVSLMNMTLISRLK